MIFRFSRNAISLFKADQEMDITLLIYIFFATHARSKCTLTGVVLDYEDGSSVTNDRQFQMTVYSSVLTSR